MKATPRTAHARGVRDGRAGREACPYRTRSLREAYWIGFAMGKLDAAAKARSNGAK